MHAIPRHHHINHPEKSDDQLVHSLDQAKEKSHLPFLVKELSVAGLVNVVSYTNQKTNLEEEVPRSVLVRSAEESVQKYLTNGIRP